MAADPSLDREVAQEWVDFLASSTFAGVTKGQYFDLGQEIVISAMLGGSAWFPLGGEQEDARSTAFDDASHSYDDELERG